MNNSSYRQLVNPPEREPPDRDWVHYNLWERIREIFQYIPERFRSTITITGIRATEIYTFGEVLGATIEQEIVRTLNDLREKWDIDDEYKAFEFVRQPQAFPDVLLRNFANGNIVLGIELKSWYLIAKEGEPSFRFRVTPAACGKQDFLVVVPWALSNVISGSPMIYMPFVENARYMAAYRNYWWQHMRNAEGDSSIITPEHAHSYPATRDEFSDSPVDDRGKNFGRIARIGLMDSYVRNFDDLDMLGIELRHWREFFKSTARTQMSL